MGRDYSKYIGPAGFNVSDYLEDSEYRRNGEDKDEDTYTPPQPKTEEGSQVPLPEEYPSAPVMNNSKPIFDWKKERQAKIDKNNLAHILRLKKFVTSANNGHKPKDSKYYRLLGDLLELMFRYERENLCKDKFRILFDEYINFYLKINRPFDSEFSRMFAMYENFIPLREEERTNQPKRKSKVTSQKYLTQTEPKDEETKKPIQLSFFNEK